MSVHQKDKHSPLPDLDDLARRILDELQRNGRLSCRELARRCKCSPTTVTDRIARMEHAGLIVGYRARVDPKRLGLRFEVIIRLSVGIEHIEQVASLLKSRPEISEYYCCDAGSLFAKAHLTSIERLGPLIDLLLPYGMPDATLVLSSILDGRDIQLPRRD